MGISNNAPYIHDSGLPLDSDFPIILASANTAVVWPASLMDYKDYNALQPVAPPL